MVARGRDGERWWGRVPAAVTVRQEPMRAALPWARVAAHVCEAIESGALAEPAPERAAAPSLANSTVA